MAIIIGPYAHKHTQLTDMYIIYAHIVYEDEHTHPSKEIHVLKYACMFVHGPTCVYMHI